MNLDQILKYVEEFERVKNGYLEGQSLFGKEAWGTSEFLNVAKNFPAETIIRDLVEEVKRLRQQLADNEAEKMIRWGHHLTFKNGSQISLPEKSEDKFQGSETHALLLPLEDEEGSHDK